MIIFIYSTLVKHLLRCSETTSVELCLVLDTAVSTGRTWQATVKPTESHEYGKRIGERLRARIVYTRKEEVWV